MRLHLLQRHIILLFTMLVGQVILMLFKAFKSKLLQQEQGFTLVEVLVAILIVTTFTLVALQAVVIAAVFKTRAKQIAEATTWIQQDLDNVKNQAAQVPYTSTTLTTPAVTNQRTFILTSVNGLRVGDALRIGTDSTSNVIASINTVASSITLDADLGTAQVISAAVIARCNAIATTQGFAAYLNANLPALTVNNPNTGTPKILGKDYTLTRSGPAGSAVPTVRNAPPFEVLEIVYSVTPQGGGSAVATINTEVIPDAAFQCPQN